MANTCNLCNKPLTIKFNTCYECKIKHSKEFGERMEKREGGVDKNKKTKPCLDCGAKMSVKSRYTRCYKCYLKTSPTIKAKNEKPVLSYKQRTELRDLENQRQKDFNDSIKKKLRGKPIRHTVAQERPEEERRERARYRNLGPLV